MLKERSKENKKMKASGLGKSSQRKGSFRSFPKEQKPDKSPQTKISDLDRVVEMAWTRKEIKALSQRLDLVEDDNEALELEERIQLEKAKMLSLEQGDDVETANQEIRSRTAASSSSIPAPDNEEYEEVMVDDDETEDVPIEEEPVVKEESDDETWGNWTAGGCLVDLGFTQQEAEDLVERYKPSGAVDNLEIFSVDEPVDDEGWEKIFVTVDSGSAVTCFPESLVQGYQVGDHQGPQQYTSASDHEVKVLGSANPVVGFEDWGVGTIKAAVLKPLKRPLISTSRMVSAGWRVVHDSEENGGSFAVHRANGRKLKMYVMGGVYKMPIWVKKHRGFARRGAVP